MDINTQNSSGMMNGMPPEVKTEKKVGPIIGALIIILILIAAALYFFGQKLNKQAPIENSTAQSTLNTQNTAAASSSDDLQTIQEELDAELSDVDYSF